MPLARAFLQQLADTRLGEAETLLDAGHYAGAYYLAGYAVELGLKACLAKQFKSEEIPDWRFFKDTKTHNALELLRLAGLEAELTRTCSADRDFESNWEIVKKWRTESRYERTSRESAYGLIEALANPGHGVLQWIRARW